MDLHRKLSESSDDSNASDHSMEHPPSFKCDEEKPEEIQRNRESFDEFKRSIEELKSEYDRNHPTLISKIKELEDITDEIESVHKNTRVGSLFGSTIGAVGGVIALVGLALAPFTLGASLALTAVGAVAGAAGGAAGGVTGAASNLTDMVKQKNLKQTIVKIISDFLEIIKPMTEHLSTISDSAADIQKTNEILSKVKFQTPARGFGDLFKIAGVADVALIGKLCAEAAKDIRVYVKAVNAVRGPAQAARAISGSAQAGRAISGSAQAGRAISGSAQAGRTISGSAQAGRTMRASAESAQFFRMSAAVGGVLSVLFLALDVASIVEDSKELNEMNQPAKERKAEEIKSETLKFILHMREVASQFQETLDKIKCVINTFN